MPNFFLLPCVRYPPNEEELYVERVYIFGGRKEKKRKCLVFVIQAGIIINLSSLNPFLRVLR